MTIKEAQETVDQWINTTGVRYFNELTNTAILMEEVGEVARIMARRYGEQSFKKSDEAVDLGDEMADVLFVLICLANQTGIDLTEALEKNLVKKNIRDAEGIKTTKNYNKKAGPLSGPAFFGLAHRRLVRCKCSLNPCGGLL